MGTLEPRFLSRKKRTVIKAGDPNAPVVLKVLSTAIEKGNFILRGGKSSRYNFRFDSIYG